MIRSKALPLLALFAACAMTVGAQEPRKSPHETITVTLEGKPITISYGRPYLKGRKAVGGTLVPYGQVWRLGADEATKLTTPVNLDIGGLAVPAGSYALFTIATKDGWTLLINKTPDQWGAFSYDKGQDLGGVPMKVSSTPSTVEQFTMAFEKKGDRAAALTLTWENTKASVDIVAK
jgi:hypothetical protein